MQRRNHSPMSTRYAGARIPRNEDPSLLRGRGCFVDDLQLPGMAHAAVMRSPHAHARIDRIDVRRARAMPGVLDIVTHADLGELGADGRGLQEWVAGGTQYDGELEDWQHPVSLPVREIHFGFGFVPQPLEDVAYDADDLHVWVLRIGIRCCP